MTKFNVGDRVRVIASIYNDPELTSSGDTIANGSLGTVIDTGTYTRVAVDGKEPWAPLFTDNEIELAPALLNVGDRVRLSPEAYPERRVYIGDMPGTIDEVNLSHYRVDWDTPAPSWNGPFHEEVELAPEAPSLAEDLRAKATAARAEADAASERMYSLRAKANALEAAAKILEDAE